MSHFIARTVLPAMTLSAVLAFPAVLAAQDDKAFDILEIECGDVMILSGIDRDTTLAFMHGYLVGKDGHDSTKGAELANATDVFLAECIDKPNANAIETMRAAVKG